MAVSRIVEQFGDDQGIQYGFDRGFHSKQLFEYWKIITEHVMTAPTSNPARKASKLFKIFTFSENVQLSGVYVFTDNAPDLRWINEAVGLNINNYSQLKPVKNYS